ncbi:MAG TPA: MFS transporter, partial [Herpetosiphonaceae bacterium]|nr:MFS transporter [Herpetosiphonaceae bacterium]
MRLFYQLLGNTLLSSVTNLTVWFGLTFFVFLETRSVFATAIISGIYLVTVAVSGFWFGSLVDRHRKKTVMLVSSAASLACYGAGLAVYLLAAADAFARPSSVTLWVLVVVLLAGVIVGNLRGIALPTLVTLIIPADRRDRANGLVGTASGISFLIVSVISGLLVGLGGMLWVLVLALALTGGTILHLLALAIPEQAPVPSDEHPHRIDIRGTLAVIRGVPGLFALLLFATFNNLLGGVFMALMDAYGLSLVSVEAWGLLWGLLSTGFIVGGLLIARFGLGRRPLRALFGANLVIWAVCSVMTIQASLILLLVGMFTYLCVVPAIEAAEQTIIQKVVPHERQGRVFGFAQSMEMAASPLTAFLIGPLAQFVFIPFMTTGAGVELIGGWFGTGPDRGIALVFTITGLIGLAMTLISMRSPAYRRLAARYRDENQAAPDHAAERVPAPDLPAA